MEHITSKENQTVKYIRKLLSSASFRKREGAFAAEGLRLCCDALKSGVEIVDALFSEDFLSAHPEFAASAQAVAERSFVLKNSIFSALSDTKTPQGVLFVIKRLDKTPDFDTMKKNGIVLALENIGDPSNLGTILRSAEAFGIDAVVLSAGCCDIYSPKVIRGSMGAVFRQPFLIVDDLPNYIRRFGEFGVTYAAVLDRDSVGLSDVHFESPCLCAVGNEANGLTQELIDACAHKLYIPMRGGAESLNAAAAASILIWEMIK